ncbi:MAG: helix-turn-helix transcriptional regulator [Rhizomicrobium sp.]|jgi:transcriptional regulator with XRE-family HTH domain
MNTKRANAIDNLVAGRIRAYRQQLGITQANVAEKLGISFQQLQKYEKGVNRIGAGRLFEIAAVLRVPIQALFPESEPTAAQASRRAEELKAISDFLASVDGWRLCRSFLQVDDLRKRKKIIALVQEIAETAASGKDRP